MFKPTVFRFDNAIMWPGAGPTTEIHAETVRDVQDEGEQYVFIHASGTAIKIDKAQVTAYGVWEDDNVPNMPNPEAYPDNVPSDTKEDAQDAGQSDVDVPEEDVQDGQDTDTAGDADTSEGDASDVGGSISDDTSVSTEDPIEPNADDVPATSDSETSEPEASTEKSLFDDLNITSFKKKRKKK